MDSSQQVLSFSLGDEVFGMNIRSVREIIQQATLTVVPRMPDFVRGVINLRGAVVPVIDLPCRFGHGPTGWGKKTCIIVVDASRDGERAELGLMVDAVSEVITIPSDQIEPAPAFGTSIRRDFIQGLGRVQGQRIVILDPDRALDIEDMAAIAEQAPA